VRGPLDRRRLGEVLEALGRRARGPGRIYLTGGATALLHGWRKSTVDVDLKLDPEPAGIFEAIAELKEEFDVNLELASPDQFIPPVPGWRDLEEGLERIVPDLPRYPSLDAVAFVERVRSFLEGQRA
jgi:hypothetical protein